MSSARAVGIFSSLVVTLGAPGAFAAEGPPSASFDPAGAAPYFATGAAAEARRRFAVEDWAGAARGFDEYVAAHKGAGDRPQARFLGAYALSRSGGFLEAAARFDELTRSYPLLADHHRLYAARAFLAAKQYKEALARARAVAADSPLAADAQLIAADALRAVGGASLDEAIALYRDYLQRFPESWRLAEVMHHLAQAAEAAAGRTDGGTEKGADLRAEAARLYTEVFVRFPTSAFAEGDGKRAAPLRPEQHLTRGLALFNQMRNEASEAEFAAALDESGAPALDAAGRCVAAFHRAQSVFKQRNRPRASPLFAAAVQACERAAPSAPSVAAEYVPKALYQGARCAAADHQPAVALSRFSAIEESYPAHAYADDARLRQAEILDDLLAKLPAPAAAAPAAATPPAMPALVEKIRALPPEKLDAGELKAARAALLASISGKYPGGDMGGEALFRLALRAFEEKRLDEAKRWLEQELAAFPREEGWGEAGRTLYWLGRIAALQNRPAEAVQLLSRAAREYPLSYYALQALSRLREQFPDDEKKLVAELSTPAPSAADLAWRFAPDALYGSPAFLRGVELARLGMGAEARRELSAAGIQTEKKGARIEDPVRAERLWVAAVLYDRAGEWALSHFIPRHVLVDYARRWPSGDNKKRWLISFPHGYEALVVENAAENGQPVALQFAIIREESAFDPLDESFANAIGLTQLTQAPAKRFARGLPYDREALRDPKINITIGARELGDQWKRTHGAAPLAIAGYNAGDAAVRRWLKAAAPATPMDVWIEHIPYDETRGYTKRVLGSLFAYQWLYEKGDPVPVLPAALPEP